MFLGQLSCLASLNMGQNCRTYCGDWGPFWKGNMLYILSWPSWEFSGRNVMLLSPEESQLLRSGATSLLIDFNITGISADLLPESIVRHEVFQSQSVVKMQQLFMLFYFFYFLLSLSYLYGVFCWCFSFGIPWREAGNVWCQLPVWNLRAVIWFPFPISSLVFSA